MTAKLVRLIDRVNDGKMWSVKDALKEAQGDFKSGKRKGKKVLIITLDDESENYAIGFYQAGMSHTQMLALCAQLQYELSKMIAGDE